MTWNDIANILIDWEQSGDVVNHRAIIRAAYFVNMMDLYEWQVPIGVYSDSTSLILRWKNLPDVQFSKLGVFSACHGPESTWVMPINFNFYSYWDKFKKVHGR